MYLSPTVAGRKGKVIFITTPEGRNWIYDLYKNSSSLDNELLFEYICYLKHFSNTIYEKIVSIFIYDFIDFNFLFNNTFFSRYRF